MNLGLSDKRDDVPSWTKAKSYGASGRDVPGSSVASLGHHDNEPVHPRKRQGHYAWLTGGACARDPDVLVGRKLPLRVPLALLECARRIHVDDPREKPESPVPLTGRGVSNRV